MGVNVGSAVRVGRGVLVGIAVGVFATIAVGTLVGVAEGMGSATSSSLSQAIRTVDTIKTVTKIRLRRKFIEDSAYSAPLGHAYG